MNIHPHPISNEWLSAYFDGELETARREQVQAHVLTCTQCQRELDALKNLRQTLAAGRLADQALTAPIAFWNEVEARLPERMLAAPSVVNVNPKELVARWLPGIALLLLNGLGQLGLAAGMGLLFIISWLPTSSPLLAYARGWADALTLGWLDWVLPSQWSGLGVFFMFIVTNASLAVTYLAWLGYELRYGEYDKVRAAA
jgi:anti-sigma factor RsiW